GLERTEHALAGFGGTRFAFQSPLTPTFTPTATWTPFFFFTPAPSFLTPTPTIDMRVANEITEPKSGDAVAGFTAIVGTALIGDFSRYDVHIASAGSENWQWLATSRNVVRNNVIYVLNTYEFADGHYDLRVRVLRRDGNYTESFVRNLEIRNANPPTPTPVFNELGTPQPASPLLQISPLEPTPTPTPRFRSYVPNGQGIFEPENGDILRGQVAVVGTVNGKTIYNPFLRYELYITESGKDDWGWLYTNDQQYWQSGIYVLDTTQLPDGLYDLRLRIVYRDSNYDEYYVTLLRIANQAPAPGLRDSGVADGKGAGLYFPRDNIELTGVADFIGTTAVPNLLRWEIYWSPASQENWQFLFSDTKPVRNGTLARLDLSLLPAGSYDFRLRIVRNDYSYSDYYVRRVHAVPPTATPIPRPPGQ
ncbi:MAG: hypothetical protein H3C34_10450, partial [Caldilineaceae bacterium]|nr:hypothetical protein [Caldilineaceae bacterium]